MYCNICHQKEHGYRELCPMWRDNGKDSLYVPDREPDEIGELVWPEDQNIE